MKQREKGKKERKKEREGFSIPAICIEYQLYKRRRKEFMDIALSLHFYLSVYPHIYIKKEEKRRGKERKGKGEMFI